MVSVGAVGSFIAGILSLLSPCSALLLPAFFAYAFQSTRQLVARTVAFLVGLCLVLVPLGAGIGWFGELVAVHRSLLIALGGWVLIALGVYTFFGFGFKLPLSSLSGRVRGTSWISVVLLGSVYGFAGFCAGPLLGAVLTTAALSTSALYGGFILLCYALGMTLPLFLLAWGWDSWGLAQAPWIRGRTLGRFNTMSMAAGVLFVMIGALFLVSHGAANLPSLISIDRQFDLQNWVMSALDGNELGALLLILIIALVGAVALLWQKTKNAETKKPRYGDSEV